MDVNTAVVNCADLVAARPLWVNGADASNRASPSRSERAAESKGADEAGLMEGQAARATEGQPPAPDSALATQDIQELLDEVNARIDSLPATSVQFSVDVAAGQVILLVVDKQTQEVIRQIPPEEFLAISSRLEDLRGLILDRSG